MPAVRSSPQQVASRRNGARAHAPAATAGKARSASERHWVMGLVTSMWRQDRLRGLELAALAAAESPPSETTVRKLGTYARYGAYIDEDIGRALQAPCVVRRRPAAWVEGGRDCTHEPERSEKGEQNFTNELSPRTYEPAQSRQSVVPTSASAQSAWLPQRNTAFGSGGDLPLAGNQGAHSLRARLHHDTFEPDLNGNRFDRAALLASGVDIPEIAAPGA